MRLENTRIKGIIDRLLADQESYAGKVSEDLGRLWRDYLAPHALQIAVALAVTTLWSVQPYAFSLTARFLVDRVLKVQQGVDVTELPKQLALYREYAVIILSFWAVFILAQWVRSVIIIKVGQNLVFVFRKVLHEKLQALHIGYFESHETGRIMSRVLDDVNVIRQWSTNQLLDIIAHVLRLFIGIGIIFVLNWKLSMIVLVSLPVYAWAFMVLRPAIRRANIALRRLNSGMYALADERISGIRVVKAFAQEGRERTSFARRMHDFVRLGIQIVTYQQGLALLAGILTAVTSGSIMYLGMRQVQSGGMSLGDVMVFVFALPNLFAQVNALTGVAAGIQAVFVILRRVFVLLDEEEQIVPGTKTLDRILPHIVFEDVTFTYPEQERPALAQVSFTIPSGSKVALMGPSGAGKSTVFQLLERFYDPHVGSVYVGGVDLREAQPRSVHSHIRMVQQEPVIFSGTIAENITYGRQEATPRLIMQAARQAELHEFVMSLPVKYETMVGQNGISLSGGQKQRLALTTALLTQPEVLLLDDTTSALDSETEAKIRATLNKALQGRTSLIITQRIATARDCDIIIVLDNGRVAQMGSHEELSSRPGFYRRIVEQQESR